VQRCPGTGELRFEMPRAAGCRASQAPALAASFDSGCTRPLRDHVSSLATFSARQSSPQLYRDSHPIEQEILGVTQSAYDTMLTNRHGAPCHARSNKVWNVRRSPLLEDQALPQASNRRRQILAVGPQ